MSVETKKQFHERRISEITERIGVCENYVNSNSQKCFEKGVGKSYIKRRNSRYDAIHSQRASMFKNEKIQLEKDLEFHKQKLKEI